MDSDATPISAWLAVAGAALVAVGTYVPWIVPAPGRDAVVQVYVSGMEWGVAGHDYLVLGFLAVGVAGAAAFRRERRGGYLAAGTGVLVALVTVGYLGTRLLGGPVALGAFVPGAGAFLTLLGAALLVAAGRHHLAAGAGDRAAAGETETPG